jgi:hypothetical protein
MVTLEDARGWRGFRVMDEVGSRVGRVAKVHGDPEAGRPLWLLVRIANADGRDTSTLVPAAEAVVAGRHVWVPYRREEMVAAAELAAASGPPEGMRERALCRHYGVETEAALAP